MKETKSIMIVGVGGQGSLLASKLLGRLLVDEGYDVKVSEVHGMSQRGGSVVTYVRFGEKVYAPLVDKGGADMLISFEPLEAARYIEFMKKDGTVVTNTHRVNPMPVITGAMSYPEEPLDALRAGGLQVDAIDALALAEQAGSVRAVNMVLMGRMSRYFDFAPEVWDRAIEACVPPKFIEINKKAFALGRAET